MKRYQIKDENSKAYTVSLKSVLCETDFSDEEVDQISSLEVGSSIHFDEGKFEIKRIEDGELTIYQKRGYESRKDYLMTISEEYGVDPNDVFALADLLGESEDFDGLINSIQDMERTGE